MVVGYGKEALVRAVTDNFGFVVGIGMSIALSGLYGTDLSPMGSRCSTTAPMGTTSFAVTPITYGSAHVETMPLML